MNRNNNNKNKRNNNRDLPPPRRAPGFLTGNDAPHHVTILPPSMHSRSDLTQHQQRGAFEAAAPSGTLRKTVVGDEVLRGPPFMEWGISRRM